MTIEEVIARIKNDDIHNIETFESHLQNDLQSDFWAEVDVTVTYPAYRFSVFKGGTRIFTVRTVKLEALQWLMYGFASQHGYPRWDYTTDPSDGYGDPQSIF